MSCKAEQLESMVQGELSPSAESELRAHAQGCAACARELAWLTAEKAVFEQRVWRETAAQIPYTFDAPAPPRRQPPRGRWALAALAAGLVFLSTGPRFSSPDADVPEATQEALAGGASFDPGWIISTTEQRYGACLVATPNAGSPCREVSYVPASFAFSRGW